MIVPKQFLLLAVVLATWVWILGKRINKKKEYEFHLSWFPHFWATNETYFQCMRVSIDFRLNYFDCLYILCSPPKPNLSLSLCPSLLWCTWHGMQCMFSANKVARETRPIKSLSINIYILKGKKSQSFFSVGQIYISFTRTVLTG